MPYEQTLVAQQISGAMISKNFDIICATVSDIGDITHHAGKCSNERKK